MKMTTITKVAVLCGLFSSFAASATADDLDAAIRRERMGTLVVEAPPGASVSVEQMRHEFWFGATLASGPLTGRMGPENQRNYESTFLKNFNAAVTENALKWHSMEPRRGQVNYAEVDAILAWADLHAIPVRGHCLFWGIENRVQNWIKTLSDAELKETLRNRATTIAQRYRGRFAEYDLNNEMIHGNYYADRLGPGITREMAAWVKAGDPAARLFVNDYDILTGNRLDDYVTHIRGFLAEDVPLAGIGVQGHLHGDTFDPAALRNALEKLAKLDLPIRVTEFNMPGQRSKYYGKRDQQLTAAEEEAKAKLLTEYYRICFAHPGVEGIMMWGFWEGANWIPQSSLYHRDWTPTPAAAAYRELVFQKWWTRWEGKAGSDGRCQVSAYFGKYRVKVDGRAQTVELKKAERTATVSIK